MDLNLTVRTGDDETIIECSGRIVDGDEATALRQVVKRLIAQGTKHIVLNLAGVRYIDSGGLGVLAGLHTSALHTGSHLRLVNPTPQTAKLLRITHLVTFFDISGMDSTESTSLKKAS